VIAGYSKVVSAVSEQKPGETNEVLREKVTEQDSLPDPAITDSAEFKCALQLLRDAIRGEKTKHSTASLEETTTRGYRLKEIDKRGKLFFLNIGEGDYVTKLKFDHVYGCWHFLFDGVTRALDSTIGRLLRIVMWSWPMWRVPHRCASSGTPTLTSTSI